MSRLLENLINAPTTQKLLSSLGVPTGVELQRFDASQTSWLRGHVLLGAVAGSQLIETAARLIAGSEAELHYPVASSNRLALESLLAQAAPSAKPYQSEPAEALRFKALVFDASGAANIEQLADMYEFFQPVIRQIASCARIVILGRPPQAQKSVRAATAQRALEGFVRCVGKEIGKKGATIQLVYVAKGAESGLAGPLQFLLSPKSAYVSAQVLRVVEPLPADVTIDWRTPLAGKIALVTGASRGIGEQIARTLARDGASVIGLDIPALQKDLQDVMMSIGGKVLTADISGATAAADIAEFLKAQGGIDIVVHNAGITRDKTLGGMSRAWWDQVININLAAEERINDALLEGGILRDGGRIVCVSSVSGIAGNFGQSNYGCSKAGVIGMVQAMVPVLAKRGITINAVAPGFIETQMTAAIPFLVREVGRRINALGQGGKPVDVAETIAFYASPLSQGVSGNVVRVCGQSMLGA
jgi:3-oxoacyl-[acyl-carrier protein] reductase